MPRRDGGRLGGRGGRGSGSGRGGYEREAHPSPHRERAGRGRGRGGRAPHHQDTARVSDMAESSLSSVSRELVEQCRISSTPGPLDPDPPETPSGPPPAAPVALESVAVGSSTPPSSSRALAPPLRPGYGTLGKECKVRANHFLVDAADKNVSQYKININPEVKSRALCRALMKKLIEQFGESHLGRLTIAYDGRNIFYTPGSLPFTTNDFVVVLSDRDSRDKTFNISISFAKSFDLYALQQFLNRRQRECPHDIITALDIVLRESPSKNYVTISRSFFSPEFGSNDIGEGLECWRGFFQSLRPTQMGLSLNVDISATSFYKPVNLLKFVSEFFTLSSFPTTLSEKQRLQIQTALKGVRVETTHVPNVCIRYKITVITSQSANELMFLLDEPEKTEISVAHYFRRKYKYNLMYESLPCIKAGSDSNPKYLPMEVCKIVDGQRYVKKLNATQVKKILNSNCKHPAIREKSILEMVMKNDYNNDMFAKNFGIRVQPKLTTIDARVLSSPKLKYHDSGLEKECEPNAGKWNMIKKKVYKGGTVDAWACISFSRHRLSIIQNFYNDLVSTCNNIGMAFCESPVICQCLKSQIENSLRELHSDSIKTLKLRNSKHRQLQLLIVVLPEIKGSYGRIKKICDTELGLVSQCCHPDQLRPKANKQYFENLALKINVKVGGCNTVLKDSITNQIPLVSVEPTIIFGADVTHPAPGEDSLPSIAAVVASMDWPHLTTYRCLFSAQPRREEIIQDLFKTTPDPKMGNSPGGMIRDLLRAFYRETNHRKPKRIIFYRDGVSEGQFNTVLLSEMNAIWKACASLEEGYRPLVTFIVVQKRHHTRLFPENENDTDKSGNILPGTVVDTKICHPTEFDFYLCSHAGIQGTSRPVHYHVLYDQNNFSANQLQSLTNNLCYTYARCTRSVSIVPAVYYAHLAAFRARYYMEAGFESGPAQVGALPVVKENVGEVMFYC